MSTPPEEDQVRVRVVLEQELAHIDSPETADAVVQRMAQLAAGKTEKAQGEAAASAPAPAATLVEQAATAGPPCEAAAAALVETAAQVVAPSPEAPKVLDAAQEVLGATPVPISPEAERGRSLLKDAILRHMGPFQAFDARLYLTINCVPHSPRLDRAANLVTLVTTGGWIWLLGVLAARGLGVPKSWPAFIVLLPSLIGATWIVEHPIKAYFRRRRPFIDIVRGLVVGTKPGSWSFPSGHTASSFASALVLSTVWPRCGPVFFTLASCVGLSRIYVGAHYPGDVAFGAIFGMSLAELIRRTVKRILSRV